jgi:hypothetical protein
MTISCHYQACPRAHERKYWQKPAFDERPAPCRPTNASDKNYYEKRRNVATCKCIAVRHNQITRLHAGFDTKNTKSHAPTGHNEASRPASTGLPTSKCLLQHWAPHFFSNSCHWHQQCCTDSNLDIVENQSIGVIWGRGARGGQMPPMFILPTNTFLATKLNRCK